MKIENAKLKTEQYDNTFLWICCYAYNPNKMLTNPYRHIQPTKIAVRVRTYFNKVIKEFVVLDEQDNDVNLKIYRGSFLYQADLFENEDECIAYYTSLLKHALIDLETNCKIQHEKLYAKQSKKHNYLNLLIEKYSQDL